MSSASSASPTVVLVRGGDVVVARDHVAALVRRLVGDGDRDMMLDDRTLPDKLQSKEPDPEAELADAVGAAVSSATTPPFLTDRRVVVVRGCAQLSRKEDVTVLAAYVADPLPTTTLVIVWDLPPESRAKRAAPPKALLEAVAVGGGVVEDIAPGSKVAAWVTERLKREPQKFDKDAVDVLVARVGEDPDTLIGLLTTIRGMFAPGARVTAPDLEGVLADEGGVPPWIVTDAIEAGDPTAAVVALQRMVGPGGRHPLQVMASLTTYVSNLLALDGGVSSADQAAKVLGGNPFVAKKALAQSQRLGSERVADLVQLVANADLDLRGRRRLTDEAVMEVLVARMASRSATVGRRAQRSGSSSGRRRSG